MRKKTLQKHVRYKTSLKRRIQRNNFLHYRPFSFPGNKHTLKSNEMDYSVRHFSSVLLAALQEALRSTEDLVPELKAAPALAYSAVCNGENLNREQQ